MQQPPADTASVFGVIRTRGNRVEAVAVIDGLGQPVDPPDTAEIETHTSPTASAGIQPSPGLIAPIADKTFVNDPKTTRWKLNSDDEST